MSFNSAARTLTILTVAVAFSASTALLAQDFRPKHTITTEAAEAIADACLAWHRNHSEESPPGIWVLDVDGIPVIVKRADGATRAAVEAARLKTQISLYTGRPSRAAQNLTGNLDGPSSLAGILDNTLIGIFQASGGLPIYVDGQLIGAVGVAGMNQDPARDDHPDELCAQTGIDAVFEN